MALPVRLCGVTALSNFLLSPWLFCGICLRFAWALFIREQVCTIAPCLPHVLRREGAYPKCTGHTRHSALRVGGQARPVDAMGPALPSVSGTWYNLVDGSSPPRGKMVLGAGGSGNGYGGDGNLSYQKSTAHTRHRSWVRSLVSLPRSRCFCLFVVYGRECTLGCMVYG